MRLQRTIKQTVIVEGEGIHSGRKARLTIKKAPVNTGIIFIRTDLESRPAISADVSNIATYSGDLRCTTIEKNGVPVHTIEHLMAALSVFDIDNAEIEIDSEELPALDGSALNYANTLKRAGSIEQEKEKREFLLKEPVICRSDRAILMALPDESLSVSYLLKYEGRECATQCEDFSLGDADKKQDLFIKEIAPARTFCRKSEVEHILKKGFGKGASYKNALVLSDGKPIGNEFRFANEPVRHKIVDLLGDLALLGVDLRAYIIGIRSGHALNRELLKKFQNLLHVNSE